MMNQSAPPVRDAGVVLLRLLLVSWVALALFISRASAIGVNFGQVANNLPSNEVTVQLVKTTAISKLKIYSPDPAVLTAFAGSGIDMVVGTYNDEIQPMASTDGYALQWVQTNIAAYPNTSIVGIALGNEVLSYLPELISFLLPALQNLQAALASVGLDKTVKVSTPNSLGIVAQSFPPSDGQFFDYNGNTIGPLLEFFAQTGAPFMVNIYPFFAYDAAPENISLDYVLFGPNAVPVYDPGSGLTYTNMFDAQVDAVYAAMSKLGYDNVSLAVTETGWPSAGDANQAGATVANAQLYIANLVKHIESGVGTPAKRGVTVDTLIFALYNENLKPGPTSERNFGLYNPVGTPMYHSGLTVSPQWYNPPPPVDALPPASYTPPPPTSFFTPPPGTYWPPPSPVALAPTAWPPPPVTPLAPTAWPPPPVTPLAPTAWPPPPVTPLPPTAWPPPPATPLPPIAWPPPPVTPLAPTAWPPPPVTPLAPTAWPPPPVTPLAPQPPPVGWSPPPPAVIGSSPPPTPIAPQPPPTGWSPPPPALLGSPPPPTPIAPQPPPIGWTPSPDPPSPVADPPSPVIGTPLAGPSLSPPAPAPASATPSSSIVPDAPAPPPDPAGSPTNSTPTWCVAKANADGGQLQIALNWACSTGGANCSVLQTGEVCFTPNTLVAHASYAFDSYYSLNNRNSWDCFFSGTGVVTTVNPSITGCVFP